MKTRLCACERTHLAFAPRRSRCGGFGRRLRGAGDVVGVLTWISQRVEEGGRGVIGDEGEYGRKASDERAQEGLLLCQTEVAREWPMVRCGCCAYLVGVLLVGSRGLGPGTHVKEVVWSTNEAVSAGEVVGRDEESEVAVGCVGDILRI